MTGTMYAGILNWLKQSENEYAFDMDRIAQMSRACHQSAQVNDHVLKILFINFSV